jgi:hypothetical protein
VVTVSGSVNSSGAKVGRVRGMVSAVGTLLVLCLELPPSRMALRALAGRG